MKKMKQRKKRSSKMVGIKADRLAKSVSYIDVQFSEVNIDVCFHVG